jgi:hypothetical protein
MEENELTIKPTGDQQTQIKNAAGKSAVELNIELGATGRLTAKDMEAVVGGVKQWGLVVGTSPLPPPPPPTP